MRHALVVGTILITTLSLAGCTVTSTSSSAGSASQVVAKKDASPVTLAAFNRIKLGAVYTGNGGSSEKDVTTHLGKPATTSKTEVLGAPKKATVFTWLPVGSTLKGASVTVSFLDGHAIAKAYANATLGHKITLAAYRAVKGGTSYTAAKAKLGTPLGESLTGTGHTSAQILTYSDGQTSVGLIFTNHVLMSKSTTK